MERADIVIVGAGPIGMACGIAAKKKRVSCIILEKGVLVNSLFHFPTNMTFFSTSNLLEIGDVPFIAHSDKPTRREALEYYRRVWQSWDLDIRLYEPALSIDLKNKGFIVRSEKKTFHSKYVILATGFFDKPVKMNVPGEDLPKVRHYYDEAHPYIGQKVLVVGGANSACDVALETFIKGSDVTMVIREEKIYKGVKYWIRPNIENRINEGSIKAYFNSYLKEILPDSVVIQSPGKEIILKNDFVLAMTGYEPDYTFLSKIGVKILENMFKTPELNENTLETNVKNMYLAGVVCGGLETNKYFIENSRVHADIIVKDIKRKERLEAKKTKMQKADEKGPSGK